MKPLNVIYLICLVTILGSCASNVPEPIRSQPVNGVTLDQVLNHVHQFKGRQIRWGGTITRVETLRDATRIEIVEQPLDGTGRPRETDQSAGRFIAQVDGFVEPEIYSRGRKLTVTGTVEMQIAGQIGEYPYDFPVVHAKSHHLWPKIQEFRDDSRFFRDPFFYDPFDDPFYYRRDRLFRRW